MPRSLVLAVFFVSSVHAAIWPDRLGPYYLQPIEIKGPGIDAQMKEYGADGDDYADYGSFRVTAWRFKDVTGAYAWALVTAHARIGNYVVSCSGKCPPDFLKLAEASLPHVSRASLPTLPVYLPRQNLVADSERYILGPLGLQADAPQVPTVAAAFDFGTEAILARYRTAQGQATLAIFSYPTPGIARQQVPQFETITGSVVKRTASLVAIVLGSADRAAAEKLLSEVNYTAAVSINETPPLELKPETAAQMLVAIFNLAGLVLGFCLISGLLVAGILFASRRFGYSGADGTLTTLHLTRK
jgi:hypothetical protein